MVILGVCRFGSLVKYIPTSVMNGFVNGFATVIFISQVKLCIGKSWETYILIAVGIAIIYLFPLLKNACFPEKGPLFACCSYFNYYIHVSIRQQRRKSRKHGFCFF